MARTDDQINIRLTGDEYAALAAAAYVRGLKSPTELVRAEASILAERVTREPAVRAAMEARAMHEAESEGRLAHLSKRSGRK